MACQTSCTGRSGKHLHIAGTWDYKWPLGSKIRVAFQARPPGDDTEFQEARKLVSEVANRWDDRLRSFMETEVVPRRDGEGIELELTDVVLEPPLGDAAWEPPGKAARAADRAGRRRRPDVFRHRSPIQDDDPDQRPYDVLVSLADFPVVRIDPFAPNGNAETIQLPFSELGSYARRVDYGEPTLFVGRFGHALTKGQSLVDYLRSHAGQQALIHEFGHALGLAHAHQNRRYAEHGGTEGQFLDPGLLQQRLEALAGIKPNSLPQDYVQRQITALWPPDTSFSDWLDPGTNDLHQLRSAMTYAYLGCMLRDDAEHEKHFLDLTERLSAPPGDGEVDPPVVPRELDLRTLILMYYPTAHRALLDRDAAQQ